MSQPNLTETGEYLLLLRNSTFGDDAPEEEGRRAITLMMDWINALRDAGVIIAGQPLAENGAVVRGKSDIVTDGPFIEAKEAVGGYLIMRASSLEEALKITAQCPVLEGGLFIEVRPLVVACALLEKYGVIPREQRILEHATP